MKLSYLHNIYYYFINNAACSITSSTFMTNYPEMKKSYSSEKFHCYFFWPSKSNFITELNCTNCDW